MTIISIDPGERNGVCLFSDDGIKTVSEIVPFVDLADFFVRVLGLNISKVIVEDFRLDKARQGSGDRLYASQVIGMARLYCALQGAEFVAQRPESRFLGAMYHGIELPAGHTPDDLSAECHGWYHLYTSGVLKPDYDRVG